MIASWLLDLTAAALVKDPALSKFTGRVSDSGEGRWTIKAAIDEAVPVPVLTDRALRALQLRAARRIFRTNCFPRCATGSADTWRKRLPKKGKRRCYEQFPHSDALVFFGATGDLAYKKIFPALQAMVKRGHLERAGHRCGQGWLESRPASGAGRNDSLEKHGGIDPAAFDKLSGLLRYVDGDYKDPATFQAIRRSSAPRNGRRTISPSHLQCSAWSWNN